MVLSEGTMQILWIVGLVVIPSAFYWLAKRDFRAGFRDGMAEAFAEGRKIMPELIENAKAEISAEADAIIDSMGDMVDEKMQKFARDDVPDMLHHIFTEENIQRLSTTAAEPIIKALVTKAGQSKGGRSRRGEGDGIIDMVGNFLGIQGASDLANFAKANPQQVAGMLTQSLGRGNGDSSTPAHSGDSWT